MEGREKSLRFGSWGDVRMSEKSLDKVVRLNK